jgi:hypothetical protein
MEAPGGRQALLVDFLAGSLGAAASVCVGQPLDTLKVQRRAAPCLPILPQQQQK